MSGFTEPSRAVPLRWGSYTDRYLGGLALISAGAIGLQGANTNFLLPLALGTAAQAIGWWIMPAAGWRRIWAVLPSLAATWILLGGPIGLGLLAVVLAAWLLVRHRPAVTLLFALPVLGTGVLLRQVFDEYDGMLPALGIIVATMVAAAWLARLVASQLASSQRHREVPTIEDVGTRRT